MTITAQEQPGSAGTSHFTAACGHAADWRRPGTALFGCSATTVNATSARRAALLRHRHGHLLGL
ncbi:MAG: hypothetical protein U0232_08800 [Thermomicrobiales bacterium]